MYEEELGRVVGSRIYSGEKTESADIISELRGKGVERILDGDIYISTSGNKPILAFNAEEEQFKKITNIWDSEIIQNIYDSIQQLDNKKVDKISGKGLSTNDYTNAEKDKLRNIEDDAQVNKVEAVEVDGETQPIQNKKVIIDLSSFAKISALKTYAKSLIVEMNSSTYVLTFYLKDGNNEVLSSQSVDLPLETMVVGGSYNDQTKSLILTLKNGQTISIPVSDLVSGLVSTDDLTTILLDYYTRSQVDDLLLGKQDALGLSIDNEGYIVQQIDD